MGEIAPQWAVSAPGASGLIWHFGAETDVLNLQCSFIEAASGLVRLQNCSHGQLCKTSLIRFKMRRFRTSLGGNTAISTSSTGPSHLNKREEQSTGNGQSARREVPWE